MASLDGGGFLRGLILSLKKLGYFVHWSVANAQDYGVPQSRKRVFVIGALKRFRLQSMLDSARMKGPPVTVWQAISDLPEVAHGNPDTRIYIGVDADGPFKPEYYRY